MHSAPNIAQNRPPLPDNVLLYDGECGFCSASIDFIVRHENEPILYFAPQQGEVGKFVLKQIYGNNTQPESIVLFRREQVLIESDAALSIAILMGGFWKTLGYIGFIFPRMIRDGVYRLFARNRHRFLKKTQCRLYPPEIQKRFLD